VLQWLSHLAWVEHAPAAIRWHMGGRADNNESCGESKMDTTIRRRSLEFFDLASPFASL
jgi:hypothetical protein